MESSELAALLGKTFIERRDVKAEQQADGAYHPVVARDGTRVPFKMPDLIAHVEGRQTFGHYLLSQDDKCRVFCFDLDFVKEPVPFVLENDVPVMLEPRKVWQFEAHPARWWLIHQARCLADSLAGRIETLGVKSAISFSGSKGLHVYGLTGSHEAEKVRKLALAVLASFKGDFELFRGNSVFRHRSTSAGTGYPSLTIEVYPKQGSLQDKDLGNLLRVPLGIHRRTNSRSYFLDRSASLDTLREVDASEVLA